VGAASVAALNRLLFRARSARGRPEPVQQHRG
jgi:hypothetical protein